MAQTGQVTVPRSHGRVAEGGWKSGVAHLGTPSLAAVPAGPALTTWDRVGSLTGVHRGTMGCGSPSHPLSQPLSAHTVTECTNHVSLHPPLVEDWQSVVGMGLLFFTFYLMAPGVTGMTNGLALCTSLLLWTALGGGSSGQHCFVYS